MSVNDDNRVDSDTVDELYLQYSKQLTFFLVGLLRDYQLAADVLQSTFVKFAEQGHATKKESRKSWLYRVAYNEAMAIRRREKIGDKVHQKVAWQAIETESVDQNLLQTEAIAQIQQALKQLPLNQQEVVRKRIYEEKKFATIAAELNVPLGTVLTRMRAALSKLRISLSQLDTSKNQPDKK